MPVMKESVGKSLVLGFDAGIDGKGETIIKNKTFSTINPDATDRGLVDAADAIASLQDNTLEEIVLVERHQLIG